MIIGTWTDKAGVVHVHTWPFPASRRTFCGEVIELSDAYHPRRLGCYECVWRWSAYEAMAANPLFEGEQVPDPS